MKPLRILIDRSVNKIRFDIGASIKNTVFYIETFMDFIYVNMQHIDYAVAKLVASVRFSALAVHTDISISAINAFSWIPLPMYHRDFSLDMMAANMKFWLSDVIGYYDASFVAAVLRLFGYAKHADYSVDNMRLAVIRPTKLYELNNKKLSEFNVSLGSITFIEIE